jgi:hypothetical protein
MVRKSIHVFVEYVKKIRPIVWILSAFLLAYALFFIRPIFWSTRVMQFPQYVPIEDPIGIDLQQYLHYSQSLIVEHQYIGNYTPFANLFFTPLLLVKFSWAYKIITVLSLLAFGGVALLFPLFADGKRQISPLVLFFFITGLFSYGFQFELERGQFNVITIFLCFLAIWIFHNHEKFRSLAYALFSIAVQLKLYPYIFIFMLIRDWKDWKNNIRRIFLLTAANIGLLLVAGLSPFQSFIKATIKGIFEPDIRIENHSLRAFFSILSDSAYERGLIWLKQYSSIVQLAVLLIIAAIIFLAILKAYRAGSTGINPLLLLACSAGALMIPSISFDYALSFLAAPVSFFILSEFSQPGEGTDKNRLNSIILLLIFSFAYSVTLYSATNSLSLLLFSNKFPALFTILITGILLSFRIKATREVNGTLES